MRYKTISSSLVSIYFNHIIARGFQYLLCQLFLHSHRLCHLKHYDCWCQKAYIFGSKQRIKKRRLQCVVSQYELQYGINRTTRDLLSRLVSLRNRRDTYKYTLYKHLKSYVQLLPRSVISFARNFLPKRIKSGENRSENTSQKISPYECSILFRITFIAHIILNFGHEYLFCVENSTAAFIRAYHGYD